MLLATTEKVIDVADKALSGTPDAARSEPFTWVMGIIVLGLVVAVLIIVFRFCAGQNAQLMDFIKGQNDVQKAMADECHKNSRESLQTVTAAASKCESALDRHADVMERVIMRLGQP